MPKYRAEPPVVEAVTFEELVAYGRTNAPSLVGGMPWSFEYRGYAVSHENDECYLLSTADGTIRVTPSDVLVTSEDGRVSTMPASDFMKTHRMVAEAADIVGTLSVTVHVDTSALAQDIRRAIRRAAERPRAWAALDEPAS